MGVRISWLMEAKNELFARASSSAGSLLSCNRSREPHPHRDAALPHEAHFRRASPTQKVMGQPEIQLILYARLGRPFEDGVEQHSVGMSVGSWDARVGHGKGGVIFAGSWRPLLMTRVADTVALTVVSGGASGDLSGNSGSMFPAAPVGLIGISTFTTTRGGGTASMREALFQGLAPDGGLFVPTPLPSLGPESTPPSPGEFVDSALWGAERLLKGYVDASTVTRVTRAALSFPVPLVEVEPGVYVLELHHGPSSAFKDVGARFMAQLMSELDESEAPLGKRTVLVATSGDTGGAVASAFHGLERYRIVTLFPRDGISARQRRQMSTLGGNVSAVAVSGTFDDCQRLAKQAFRQPRIQERHRLTSANSINVGRLLPQSFYFIHAWIQLGGAPARFVVPSGNLGNLCAGLVAGLAGMPTLGFLSASNANDVFPRYLRTGSFQARDAVPTLSNAMDVGAPSNFERIQWLFRDDPKSLSNVVSGASVSDAETADCIATVYRRTGYVLDPHSAVAYRAQERHHGRGDGPTVVLATAHPAKFPDVVERAVGQAVELPEGLAAMMDAEEHFAHIAPTLAALEDFLADE